MSEQVGREAVGAADQEDDASHPGVTQPPEPRSEGPRGIGSPMLVAGDHGSAAYALTFQGAQQRLALRQLARLSGVNLDHLHGTQALGAADGAGAGDIVGDQIALRPATKPADGQYGYAHEGARRLMRPGSGDFGIGGDAAMAAAARLN